MINSEDKTAKTEKYSSTAQRIIEAVKALSKLLKFVVKDGLDGT